MRNLRVKLQGYLDSFQKLHLIIPTPLTIKNIQLILRLVNIPKTYNRFNENDLEKNLRSVIRQEHPKIQIFPT